MALLPLLLLTCGQSAVAGGVVTPSWPGMPTLAVPDGWSVDPQAGDWADGLSEVARADQWIKIPAQAAAVVTMKDTTHYPADDAQGRIQATDYHASVFLSSPAGAREGYGIGLPFTVRTVAFGTIPIQVGVQIEQVRDKADLPVPLQAVITQTIYPTTHEIRPGVIANESNSARLTGRVRLRLTALKVDGVDVGMGDCVSSAVDLDLTSHAAWRGDPLTDPATDPRLASLPSGSTGIVDWLAARGEAEVAGGAVSGDVDIPAFSHCLTKSGEDISPLLTSAVAGSGNTVTIGFGALGSEVNAPKDKICGTYLPGTQILVNRGPFRGDPSDCDPAFGPPNFNYPVRKK